MAILGGGVAGLLTLDRLRGLGVDAWLLEAGALGAGQSAGSQGIIHGGLKYTLRGLLTGSAASIADMPGLWRSMLEGRSQPDLRGVRVRSQSCVLWQTGGVRSRAGMVGARAGLRVKPVRMEEAERPPALRGLRGAIYRLDEPVLDPVSLLGVLAERHRPRLLRIDGRSVTMAGPPATIDFRSHPEDGPLRHGRLHASVVVLCAGAGNEALRAAMGLPGGAMQRRPLHQVLVRGAALPAINGHCVDGAATRVTITSDVDAAGRTVWQVGGRLAEEGVALDRASLLFRAAEELRSVLPGVAFSGCEWGSWRVDRAEAASAGRRPEDAWVRREGPVITVWPTKLVLAPRAAEEVLSLLGADAAPGAGRAPEPADSAFAGWRPPPCAAPPWDDPASWSGST